MDGGAAEGKRGERRAEAVAPYLIPPILHAAAAASKSECERAKLGSREDEARVCVRVAHSVSHLLVMSHLMGAPAPPYLI